MKYSENRREEKKDGSVINGYCTIQLDKDIRECTGQIVLER